MRKIIVFLIRKKLGVKKNEPFKFRNQNSNSIVYAFVNDNLLKLQTRKDGSYVFCKLSSCSLNFLLSSKCYIKPMKQMRLVTLENVYGYQKR